MRVAPGRVGSVGRVSIAHPDAKSSRRCCSRAGCAWAVSAKNASRSEESLRAAREAFVTVLGAGPCQVTLGLRRAGSRGDEHDPGRLRGAAPCRRPGSRYRSGTEVGRFLAVRAYVSSSGRLALAAPTECRGSHAEAPQTEERHGAGLGDGGHRNCTGKGLFPA